MYNLRNIFQAIRNTGNPAACAVDTELTEATLNAYYRQLPPEKRIEYLVEDLEGLDRYILFCVTRPTEDRDNDYIDGLKIDRADLVAELKALEMKG